MVKTQILPAIQLLALEQKQVSISQTPTALIHYYLSEKEKEQDRPLPPLAQTVEHILSHGQDEITIPYVESVLQSLQTIAEEPVYQHQDQYRLENIPGYLVLLKNGSQDLRVKALEQIEQILLRIHNAHAIAWDFGGVLMDGHNKFFIELYARAKGADLSREQLLKLWEVIFKNDPIPGVTYDALKIGLATPEQFARHALEHFSAAFEAVGQEPIQIAEQEIYSFLTLYYSHYDPKHENREVLQRIHQLGIRQYGLTNNFMAKIEYFLEQQEFDYLNWLIMIVSEKFGASKPDPKIYLSFKQHVFLDRFARELLQVDLPDRVVEQLWQAIFQSDPQNQRNFAAYQQQQTSLEHLCQYAIEQYNQVLSELGYAGMNVPLWAGWLCQFWAQEYDRSAQQTIFVDDKIKNLNQAFKYEGILGVQYDANQGQSLVAQPVIQELLEQEQLKAVVRTLRELATDETALGQRVQQALDRLMPFRIRQEKLFWKTHATQHQQIIDTLSNEQIYVLLQRHYAQLYQTHFRLGQLVSQQYALVHRLTLLPDYTYDEARQIVLELFETSDLFLDQNRDLYPWQNTELPERIAPDLGDLQEQESLLKKRLLPEIKCKILDFITALDVIHQPTMQELVNRLQTDTIDLETLKQVTDDIVQHLTTLKSTWVVHWQEVEQLLQNVQTTLADGQSSGQATQSLLTKKLQQWHQQFYEQAQRTFADLLPLQRMIADWEQDIHQLESTYFQQYHRWKILKDRERIALYQDTSLEVVRQQFSPEELYQFIRGMMLRVYDMPCWKDVTKPTIVLVSGASGSGKSTLSSYLARSCGIQKVFSTDETGRANTQALLNFLFGHEEAMAVFPALYQSSFEGTLESYYYQAILTMIGVEGLAKRLHKQNTSALIEGVGLMPGLLSEPMFELLNIDWIVLQVEQQQHFDHFVRRSQAATPRQAERYQARFAMIRQIHAQMLETGLRCGLTIVENAGPIQKAVQMAMERIKGPLTDQFVEICDPLRQAMEELLVAQRQHLPVKIRFDVKRTALNFGVEENTIVALLHQFGFEAVPGRRHQWIRQPLPT